ncbi:hypothetical protein [Vibrio penaeicida]|uniref:hypothetical protein n=1 Tax=Vibrio penaeicida TaxID=104609 RepID=UPI000CE9DD1E|nr:hypothetical protein [Vibrio penaeicida]
MTKSLLITLCYLISFSSFASAIGTDRFKIDIPTHFAIPAYQSNNGEQTWTYVTELGTLIISEQRCDKACLVVSQDDVDMYNTHERMKNHGSVIIEKNDVVGWLVHSPTYSNTFTSEVTFSHLDASISFHFIYKKANSSLDTHRSLVEFIRLINNIEFL